MRAAGVDGLPCVFHGEDSNEPDFIACLSLARRVQQKTRSAMIQLPIVCTQTSMYVPNPDHLRTCTHTAHPTHTHTHTHTAAHLLHAAERVSKWSSRPRIQLPPGSCLNPTRASTSSATSPGRKAARSPEEEQT